MKKYKNYIYDKFLKTHQDYIRAINHGWQTGNGQLIYSFLDNAYTGVIYSNSFGCLGMTKESLIASTDATLEKAWNEGVRWEAKKRMTLTNIDGDVMVISYRLHMYYPGVPIHKGIAMMVEVWRYVNGKWCLLRDIQEERDNEVQQNIYCSSFMRHHAKFFKGLTQVKLRQIGKEIILPYISKTFEGRVSLNSESAKGMSIDDLIGFEPNLSIKEYKKNYLSRNKTEIILHHAYMKIIDRRAIEIISSEVWCWHEDRWVLQRNFQECLEVEMPKEVLIRNY